MEKRRSSAGVYPSDTETANTPNQVPLQKNIIGVFPICFIIFKNKTQDTEVTPDYYTVFHSYLFSQNWGD